MINKLIAGIIATSIIFNVNSSVIKNIYAFTKDVYSEVANKESLEDINENSADIIGSNATEFSNVSTEQMQKDFESVANASIAELSEDNTKSIPEFSKFIYLSDIGYDTSKSKVSTIKKDTAISGSSMKLDIGEEGIKTFSKGYCVQAPGSLVFNIGDYSNSKPILSTYIGIDNSQAGNKGHNKADGSTFSFLVSDDGEDWTQVGESTTIKQGDKGKYIHLNISSKKYLKIKIDSNKSDWWDHSDLCDLRLIEDGYDINNESPYTGLKTLDEYDRIISSRSIEENYQNHKKEVLERELVNRLGYNNILTASKSVDGVADALHWLQSDQQALQLFIEAGAYYGGNGYNALVALGKLYKSYSNDMDNIIYKKMLLATAAAYSREVRNYLVDYGGSYVPSDPIERYKIMKSLYDNGKFVRKSEFENYPMELVRVVMGARLSDDEIIWFRNYIDKKYPNVSNNGRYHGYGYVWYNKGNLGDQAYYDEVNYKKWDDKYQFKGTDLELGQKNGYGSVYKRIWMMLEAGGICWGITGVGNAACNIQGIASLHTFQPGHEAEMTYNTINGKGAWILNNNVSGWPSSFSKWGNSTNTEVRLPLQWGNMDFNVKNSGNNSTYIILAQDAFNNYDSYLKSMYYTLIANSYSGERKEEAYNKALESYNKNVDATYGLIKLYRDSENIADEKWLSLGTRIAEDYKFFPAPMVNLLSLVIDRLSNDTYKAQLNTLKTMSLQRASNATSEDTTQAADCKAIANSLLGNNSIELATFSFSGEDSNTVKLNSFYDNSNLAIRISLDNGKTWLKFNESGNDSIYTSSHAVKLTDEQVDKINEQDDILVGLMGVSLDSNYRIDIKPGKALSNSIYKNDWENALIGDVDNLEYSLNNGETWQDYKGGLDTDIRFEGDIVVKFRYKPHDVYLQGPVGQYTFNSDNINEESKYLQLRHVSLVDFSSQQSTSKDHAAKNFIDGNANTVWHTKYSTYDSKFYVVEFDKVRFINKLTYLPGGKNGRLKSGEIYSSMDGVTWELASTFSGLENNGKLQTINLGKNLETKYLKIVATENYGNSIEEGKMYFSGKMLNFYEDTTKVYNPEKDVKINYSVTEPTTSNVTATIVLPKGCSIVEGEASEYVFTDNGDHVFNYIDANGDLHSITAKVNNIDRLLPTMTYDFDEKNPTNKDVTLTIKSFSEEDVKVVGIEEMLDEDKRIDKKITEDCNYDNIDEEFNVYSNSYTFTENKTVVFKIMDRAGNINSIPVTVDWIDRIAPTANIEFNTTSTTDKDVIATVVNVSEEVIFEDGSNGSHTFNENGSYTFIIKDRAGNVTRLEANVDWIDKEGDNNSSNCTQSETTPVKYDNREVLPDGNAEYGIIIPTAILFDDVKTQDNVDVEITGINGFDLTDWTTLTVKASVQSLNAYQLRLNGNGPEYATYDLKYTGNNSTFADVSKKDITTKLGVGGNSKAKVTGTANLKDKSHATKKGQYKDILTYSFVEEANQKK